MQQILVSSTELHPLRNQPHPADGAADAGPQECGPPVPLLQGAPLQAQVHADRAGDEAQFPAAGRGVCLSLMSSAEFNPQGWCSRLCLYTPTLRAQSWASCTRIVLQNRAAFRMHIHLDVRADTRAETHGTIIAARCPVGTRTPSQRTPTFFEQTHHDFRAFSRRLHFGRSFVYNC